MAVQFVQHWRELEVCFPCTNISQFCPFVVYVSVLDWMMILAAYSCDHWEYQRNHSWESDGWDSNYFILRLIKTGIIKDLWIMPLRPKTFKMVKEQERQAELTGIELRAIGIPCHCSTATLVVVLASLVMYQLQATFLVE